MFFDQKDEEDCDIRITVGDSGNKYNYIYFIPIIFGKPNMLLPQNLYCS